MLFDHFFDHEIKTKTPHFWGVSVSAYVSYIY